MVNETTVGVFCPFKYGKGLPARSRNSLGSIPVYGSNGIVGWHDVPYTTAPTVVIGRKGTVGAVHYSPIPCWPIDTTFFIEYSDPQEARFTYYLLKTLGFELMNSDSAVPGLNRDASHVIKIPLYDKTYRHAISHILGALDDKIELNRQMCKTLEDTAQAIFKSWFIDFDPVHAKAAGKQPKGMNPAIAALFPDSFDDSHLIPKGWSLDGLDSLGTFLNGLALQKYPPTDDEWLPAIKIAQLRTNDTRNADKVSSSIGKEYIVKDGDILFSWSGSLECVLWSGGKGALNQHLFKVTSTDYPKWFVYFWIHHHLPEFRHIAAGKATTMGHIQRHHLKEAKVIIPSSNILEIANRIIDPLFENIVIRSLESKQLEYIRDLLLPQLISGSLRVSDAENIINRCR